ncbi:MAG: FkbM family methyltransferase [Planctomycetes bacterium]|nr:FkbM family methyltransferase [Planctomycetota bacterium]
MSGFTIMRRLAGRLRRAVFGDYVIVRQPLTQAWHHLDAMRRRIVGGQLVVRFDNVPADFAVDARSDLAARALADGDYEPEIVSLLPALPLDGDFINVGANVGIIAVGILLSGSRRRVVCVEPLPECVKLLERNLDQAVVRQRAMIVTAAATSESASRGTTLFTVPGRPEYTSGGTLVHASVRGALSEPVVVDSVRIDDLVATEGLNVVGIIMDCEGGEHRALLGARDVIARCRPVLILELDDAMLAANGASLSQVLEFLDHHAYDVRDAVTLSPVDWTTFSGTVVGVHQSASGPLYAAMTRCGFQPIVT